jgi:hypothetical protein
MKLNHLWNKWRERREKEKKEEDKRKENEKDLWFLIDEKKWEHFEKNDEKFKIFWNSLPKKESDYHYNENIEEPFLKTENELNIWKKNIALIETKSYKEGEWKPDFLVISGGGSRGFYLPPILYALSELNKMDRIIGLAGTSIGSFAVGLIVLGFSYEEILKISSSIDFDIISEYVKVSNFTEYGFFSKQDWLRDFLSCCIFEKLGVKDITLKDLYEKTKIPICFNAVSKKEKRMIYLSTFTYPNWTLIDCLCATSCFPIFFEPFKKDEDEFIDGGLVNTYLVELFPPERTLGIYIGKRHPTSDRLLKIEEDTFQWFPGMFKAFSLLAWCYSMVSYQIESGIYLNCKKQNGKTPNEIQIIIDHSLSVTSIDISQEQKNNILFHGISIGLYYGLIVWEEWNKQIK